MMEKADSGHRRTAQEGPEASEAPPHISAPRANLGDLFYSQRIPFTLDLVGRKFGSNMNMKLAVFEQVLSEAHEPAPTSHNQRAGTVFHRCSSIEVALDER